MKRILSLILCSLVILALVCSLGACRARASAYEVLCAFSHRYPLPDGSFYDSLAHEEADTYLSPDLFSLLFSRPDGGDDREDILEMALFLGSSSLCVSEMGIFFCADRDAAYEVASLVRGRLNMLLDMPLADTSAAEDATVTLFGRVVVYTVLPDNEKALRTLKRLF